MDEWQEPYRFVVRVVESKSKGPCRAGHRVGDEWEFDYCTPLGLCGEAFHCIYPLVHAMRLGANLWADVDDGRGHDPDVAFAYCPDDAWLKFEVRRTANR